MPIELNLGINPDRFVSRHWLFVPTERATQPPNGTSIPYRGLIILSGVALVNLRGNSESNWLRERVTLNLNNDLASAINQAPWRPRSGYFWIFRIEQWVPFATVNARYNAHVANHDGSAVDTFRLEPTRGAVLHADVAVRDTDAYLYRMGYHLDLYGRLEEQQIPG